MKTLICGRGIVLVFSLLVFISDVIQAQINSDLVHSISDNSKGDNNYTSQPLSQIPITHLLLQSEEYRHIKELREKLKHQSNVIIFPNLGEEREFFARDIADLNSWNKIN